jgi:outer membrane protein assembly factor BamB
VRNPRIFEGEYVKHLTLFFGAAFAVSIMGAFGGSPALAAEAGTNWTQAGYNAQHTGDNPFETTITRSNVGSLVRVFSTPITTGPDPIVANGVAYLSDSIDGDVQAINSETGAVEWTRNACNSGEETTAPAFARGKIWVGLDDPGTAALTSNGAPIACVTGDLYTSPPSAANGVVYAGGQDGVVVAINATTDAVAWQTCLQCGAGGGPDLDTPAVSTDGNWLFISKLNAHTGAVVWTRYVDSCGESAVTVSGTDLFVSGCAVYGLSAATGKILWHSTKIGSSISTPAVAGGIVYVTALGNYPGTFAINAATGKTVWSQPDFLGLLYPPTVANGVVYVDFPEISSLVAYDSTTGVELGGVETVGVREFTGSAIVVNGCVYIVSFDFENDDNYQLDAYQPRS